MNNILRLKYTFVLLFLFFISCTSTFYNVAPVDNKSKSKCDTIFSSYNIRIVNIGKIGISSVALNTDSGFVTLSGVKPGDTTCYFPIPPLYKNAEYKIFALRISSFGKAYSYQFGVQPLYHVESEKLIPGFYTFNVELSRNHMIPGVNKKKRKIYAGRKWISKD